MNRDRVNDMQEKILIVDDDPGHLSMLSAALEESGYQIHAAPNGDIALKVALGRIPDLILLDISLGDKEMDGFTVCRMLKENPATENIPVIFVTGMREIESIVDGFRVGGVDYIIKPFAEEEVLARVQNHLKIQRLAEELRQKNLELQQEIKRREQADKALEVAKDDGRKKDEQLSVISEQEAKRWGIDGFIGKSSTFAGILKDINRLRETKTVNVLITGENGTGKELVARAIHFGGPRAKSPFISVNCSAIPRELAESILFGHVKGAFTGATAAQKGKFEQANGGTLFLDEVGLMSLELQPKLLRVLEVGRFTPLGGREKQVDVRILAATNVDLMEKIKQGSFREDLYYRLNQYEVDVPPLRDRREDIPLLASHFHRIFAADLGKERVTLSPSALELLESYHFPGNVRELRNIIIQALVECDGPEILPEHLRFPKTGEATDSRSKDQSWESFIKRILSETKGYSEAVKKFRRYLVELTLRESDWNNHEAAKRLNMDRPNLIKLIKHLGIRSPRRDT